jgi:GAF domain-containing protein
MTREHAPVDLAEVLSDVARTLSSESSLEETMRAIAEGSVRTVPGADYAGITLVRSRKSLEPVAATDDLVAESDRAQQDLGEGPCLDAIWTEETVSVEDLEHDERWPRFGKRALELGVRSMLSFQLFTEGNNLGALNLYSRETSAFDEESEHIGLLFATHAAVALRGAQQERHLSEAIRSRDVIGMAKGILMERHKIDEQLAFSLLVKTSQSSDMKLHDIAAFLVRTGDADATGAPS